MKRQLARNRKKKAPADSAMLVSIPAKSSRGAVKPISFPPTILSPQTILRTPAAGSLLSIEHFSADEIMGVLRQAERWRELKVKHLLQDRRVALLFYEASTRTRVSFEFAAKSLGASTTVITATASSIEKGESLLDTGFTLEAIGVDVIVIRHPRAGAPHVMARNLRIPVINAGDGMHEHPSQALADACTILQQKKSIGGLKVVIVGDILHSRVARSNVHLLSKFGARITLCGPPELLPDCARELATGVEISRSLEQALARADVIMLLRVQKERLIDLQLDVDEYVGAYQLTSERLALAHADAIVLHPGPIMRGIELAGEIAELPQSKILDQVQNGLVVRQALLTRAFGIEV